MSLDIYNKIGLGYDLNDYIKLGNKVLNIPKYNEQTGERMPDIIRKQAVIRLGNHEFSKSEFNEYLYSFQTKDKDYYYVNLSEDCEYSNSELHCFIGLVLQKSNDCNSLFLIESPTIEQVQRVCQMEIVKELEIRDIPKVYAINQLSY